MDNSLLDVRDINHKYIVVERRDIVFNKLFEIKLEEQQIEINDSYNKVLYASDDPEELIAIEQYFEKIWTTKRVKNNSPVITDKYCTTINSIYNLEYRAIFKNYNFRYKEYLFYDTTGGYLYEDDYFYAVTKDTDLWLTIFNKQTNNVVFLRFTKDIYNIHISQMIKDPLNILKKMDGKLLLHSSSGKFHSKNIVFPAQKGAGKSTLIMALLNENGKYCGNDSNFIFLRNKEIYVEKNPHCLRLGKETIEHNYILKKYFSDETNCSKSKMYRANIVMNGKTQFVPSSLEDIYKRECIVKNIEKVDYFIFPKMNITENNYEMKIISCEKAQKMLLDSIEDADHRICWLPFCPEEKLVNIEKDIARKLVINMPTCFELHYSGDISKACQIIKSQII